VTDFKETEMRKMCRYCRMRLPTPTSNDREGFCCRGCYNSFFPIYVGRASDALHVERLYLKGASHKLLDAIDRRHHAWYLPRLDASGRPDHFTARPARSVLEVTANTSRPRQLGTQLVLSLRANGPW
jgi:hypothetical protein